MFLLLCLYTFFVFIRPQEYIGFFKGLPFMPVILIGMIIGVILKPGKIFQFPQDKFLIFFFIMGVISHILHFYFGGAYYYFTKFLTVLILYYVIISALDTIEKIERYFLVIILLTLVLALHGIDQYFNNGIGWTGQTFAPGTTRIRYIGIFSDPNDLSLIFLFSLPLLVYFLRQNKNFIYKIFYFLAFGVILWATILTQSRGAIMSLGSMMAYYGVRRYGFKKGIIIAVILLIPVIFVYREAQFLTISTEEDSAHGRIEAWYEGFQMLRMSPIWGVGPGMFTEYNYLTAHNSFVLCFAENGIVGYFFWLGAIYYTFIGLTKSINYELIDMEEGSIITPSFFLSISLIGFLTASFFLSRTYSNILYIILGVISAFLYVLEDRYDVRFYGEGFQPDYLKIGMVAAASLVVIYLFVRFSV